MCLGEEEIGIIRDRETLAAVMKIKEEDGLSPIRLYPCFAGIAAGKNTTAEKAEKKHPIPSSEKAPSSLSFMPPLKNACISSPFGERDGKIHKGTDLAAPFGAPIYAANSGTVSFSGEEEGYGNLLILRHDDNYETYYAHCDRLLFEAGEAVEAGEMVAEVGSTGKSTGPHLHFEIRKNGTPQDPNDLLGGFYK